MSSPLVCPIPHGATARRLEWVYLPAHLRALIERRCGAAVVEASSQGAGFTPGFASVLSCEDGSRHFVKAASRVAQRAIAEAYLDEARILGALPAAAPAPALRWAHADEEWVALGIEHVAARAPARPWGYDELGRSLEVLAEVARVLTPAPAALGLPTVADELGGLAACWADVTSTAAGLAHLAERRAQAAALARDFAALSRGDSVVHTDVRDDNLLLAEDGRTLLCDWNWPARGAPWLDTVALLIGPRGDGLDAEALLATSPLTCDVPASHVDSFLALVTGYLLDSAAKPVPSSSPHLRAAQRWQGEVCWSWLCERRGWT